MDDSGFGWADADECMKDYPSSSPESSEPYVEWEDAFLDPRANINWPQLPIIEGDHIEEEKKEVEEKIEDAYGTEEMDLDAESTKSTEEAEEPSQKGRVGRRVKEITKLLLLFAPHRGSEAKVKKEYLRVELLRGFKRAIREVLIKVMPRKKIHGFDPKNKAILAIWGDFRLYIRKNHDLHELAQTENGPVTEGKSKRKGGETTRAAAKTYNDTYCRQFFETESVRAAFRLYLNVVFGDMNPSCLQEKFKFEPRSKVLSEQLANWERLRHYLYEEMFSELKIAENSTELARNFEFMRIK